MVVCKFFQQGNCRYGQSCRFEHIYGSKYSYHAAAAPQPIAQEGVSDEQLVNQVLLDVQAALKGGQWILSCYAPYKEKPNFPGFTELSMEEARLFIYEAKANNTLDQAITHMNSLINEATKKYEQLLQASPSIIKVLRSLYKGAIVPSPFTNSQPSGFGSGSAATSIFRSAVQGPSVFGQTASNNTSSIFNQSPGFGQQVNQTPSVFGTNQENAKSIFAQANQNVFAPSQPTNAFPTSPDTSAKSIFSQATQNVFGQSNNPASIFSEASNSAFGKPSDPFNLQKDPFNQQKDPFSLQKDPFGQQKDPFSQKQDPFNQHNPFAPAAAQSIFQMADKQNNTNISNVYSLDNDLSPQDIEAFQASDFKLGFIPELPPPQSLCF